VLPSHSNKENVSLHSQQQNKILVREYNLKPNPYLNKPNEEDGMVILSNRTGGNDKYPQTASASTEHSDANLNLTTNFNKHMNETNSFMLNSVVYKNELNSKPTFRETPKSATPFQNKLEENKTCRYDQMKEMVEESYADPKHLQDYRAKAIQL